eukprot:SAG11_NODE_10342_length_838_cov_1.043302_1_plen_108_part_00
MLRIYGMSCLNQTARRNLLQVLAKRASILGRKAPRQRRATYLAAVHRAIPSKCWMLGGPEDGQIAVLDRLIMVHARTILCDPSPSQLPRDHSLAGYCPYGCNYMRGN